MRSLSLKTLQEKYVQCTCTLKNTPQPEYEIQHTYMSKASCPKSKILLSSFFLTRTVRTYVSSEIVKPGSQYDAGRCINCVASSDVQTL